MRHRRRTSGHEASKRFDNLAHPWARDGGDERGVLSLDVGVWISDTQARLKYPAFSVNRVWHVASKREVHNHLTPVLYEIDTHQMAAFSIELEVTDEQLMSRIRGGDEAAL